MATTKSSRVIKVTPYELKRHRATGFSNLETRIAISSLPQNKDFQILSQEVLNLTKNDKPEDVICVTFLMDKRTVSFYLLCLCCDYLYPLL